jgi:glutamyl-tRNA reductase
MDPRQVYLLGVSFRTAPAAVREALSFDDSQAANLLRESAKENPQFEAAILSTCNRTEFYLVAPPDGDHAHDWLMKLRRLRPSAQILREDCLRYQETGTGAARHLFGVACGIDSAILGDVQILGQVKRAMAIAGECGTLGRTLDQLFQRAIRTGKRARDKTAIGLGAASVGSAIVSMIGDGLLEWKQEPNIVLIGAGNIARDIARHLAKRGLGKLTIINRTLTGAMELAADCGAKSLAWSCLPDALVNCHCVIAATGASTPILRWELLERVARLRVDRELIVIDAGLPRNVETGAPVKLIDIDGIRELQARHLANRQAAVPEVERIVAKEVQSWQRWMAALPIEGVIKRIYEEAFQQSRLTARQLIQSGPLSETDAEELIRRSYKKLLHEHVQRLRRLSAEMPLGKEDPSVADVRA